MSRPVRVAVWGCGHGTLDRVYDAIAELTKRSSDGKPVDVLLCCGDFQAARNEQDMECMACPTKFRMMQDFYKYYSGVKVAPVLTVFIGGNHEAANHLQELPYGGWVAPNIFYLGSSGCVRLGGIRIGGISGIFKGYDYRQGYFECAPYTDDTARSVFHMREFDVWRMQHMRPSTPATADRAASAAAGPAPQGPLDIVLSHDWPEGVYNHGDVRGLLRRKQHFAEEVAAGKLGNPETARLLPVLRPRFWFSAHLHVKFAALVQHGSGGGGGSSGGAGGHGGYGGGGGAPLHPGSHNSAAAAAGGAGGLAAHAAAASSGGESTYFLALDKCLPGRQYLQIIDVAPQAAGALPAAVGDDSGSALGAAAAGGVPPAADDAGTAAAPAGLAARLRLEYDAEWLAVVRRTHALLPAQRSYPRLPPAGQVTAAEVAATRELLARALQTNASAAAAASGTGASVAGGGASGDAAVADAAAAVASSALDVSAPLYIPENFIATVPGYVPPYPGADQAPARRVPPPQRMGNPQTDALLAALGLPHVVTIPHHPGQSQMGGAPPAASAAAGPQQRPGAGYSAADGGGGAYAAGGYHGGHVAGGGPMGAGYYPGAGSAAAASGGDPFAHTQQQPQHAFGPRPGGGMLVPSQAYHAGHAGSGGGHAGSSMAAGARGGSRPSFASRLPPPAKAGGGGAGGSAAFGNTGSAGYWGDPAASRAGADAQAGGSDGVAPACMAVDGHPADVDADVAAALSFVPSGDAAAEFHEAQWLRPTTEGHTSSNRMSAAAPAPVSAAAIDGGAASSASQAGGSGGAVAAAGIVAGPAPDPSEISLDDI